MANRLVVFLHGWSVSNTDTYGGLPERLAASGDIAGDTIELKEIRLARYVSFHDEVRMDDLSRALESAVRTEFADAIASGQRFTMITHSTGGPLAREWWYRYYASQGADNRCPMSHLIMLAPANFGSALAQLGKSRVSQLKSWAEGVEPGQGVLDWLELGSPEAWELNEAWIRGKFAQNPSAPVFPFVISGQSIDRSLYDHVNSYTGENGSDGVVRCASANLNACLVRLRQQPIATAEDPASSPLELRPKTIAKAPKTAFRLLEGASHSGKDMGIMRSVRANGASMPAVVNAIRSALGVTTSAEYDRLCSQFDTESAAVYVAERCELEKVTVLPDRKFIHDAMSMLVFRVTDSDGNPVNNFDLLLTGPESDPNNLPQGFFKDRQANSRAKNTVTYFVNHELLMGSEAVGPTGSGDVWRGKTVGIDDLGIRVEGRPSEGFAHYVPAEYEARATQFATAIVPHQTTLVDIVLQRVVHEGALQLGHGTDRRGSFKNQAEGRVIPERDDGA